MWRLYVRKEYLNNVISIGKFFLNRHFKFNGGDIYYYYSLQRKMILSILEGLEVYLYSIRWLVMMVNLCLSMEGHGSTS